MDGSFEGPAEIDEAAMTVVLQFGKDLWLNKKKEWISMNFKPIIDVPSR